MSARRRGAGEGTIYQVKSGAKAGKWIGAVTVSLPGEPQRRKTFTADTREGARQAILQAQRDGLAPAAKTPSLTVAGLVEARLRERSTRVKPRTIEQYRDILRVHIDPYIGSRRADRLTPEELDRYFERLTQAGRSLHVARLCRAVLSGAYRWGMRRRMVGLNPLQMIEPQRIPRVRMRVWSDRQAAAFLTAAKDDELHALFVLALSTGMRLGELLALRWSDVDLHRGAVSVQETAGETKTGAPQMGEAKTRRSLRRIELPALAVDALKEQRERSLRTYVHRTSPYVFPDSLGGARHARNVRERHFRPVMRRANLPAIRFHDLRHTFASLALANGVPLKVVSETLGHASPEFTARVYQHVSATLQKESAKTIDGVLRAAIAER